MYFKRWGLLAPPPRKVSLLKDLPTLLFLREYYSIGRRTSIGVQACWRARSYHLFCLSQKLMTLVILTSLIKEHIVSISYLFLDSTRFAIYILKYLIKRREQWITSNTTNLSSGSLNHQALQKK